ncbi:MAG TPA: thioesterase II family protein [Pyrinomonadaceae bacterium]
MVTLRNTPDWFTTPEPNPQAELRLFCFPYAGGGETIFRRWPSHLPSTIEVCAAQLPGRGRRMKEPPRTRLSTLAREIADAARPYLDKPFALFGHSMGAVIAFELARLLRRETGTAPLRLFVSGHRAPQIPKSVPSIHNLPEEDFFEELRRFNGTPAEVLEHRELMGLMLPLLRADFELIETYTYTDAEPLDCPITAFGGERDVSVSRAELERWREQTAANFFLHMFEGDHFFLNEAGPRLLQIIRRDLGTA